MSGFAHLHLHTEFSLLDGASRIDNLFELCQKMGMKAVAITDHGNMYGAYHFFVKANETDPKTGKRKYNVKPIIGCEFYVADDIKIKSGRDTNYHLVLLAKNNTGYKNLVKLNSIAFVDGFYYKPRIDFETLSRYSEGLICLSACLAGQLPRYLLDNRNEDADIIVKKYKALFGDDYYIELQDHGIAEQRFLNPKLIEIAKKHNVSLVATNDVHYLHKSDAEMQDILLCVQTGHYVDDADRMRFDGEEFYLKSGDEMEKIFASVPEAIANTLKIAEKCDVQIEKEKLLPSYVPPDGLTPEQYLRILMEEGLKERYGEITPEIRERAEYEFGIISKMGYVEYYLIVWDFIHYAESNDIPVGPGRGSGAGSIIAYAIGITKVEPLRYNLLFERFLNPDRISMPDFDVDFCMDRRGEVINYVIEKYGKDNVAQIVTFGTMAVKNAIKDVCRVLRVPYSEGDKVTKLIPNMSKHNLRQILGLDLYEGADVRIAEVREIYDNDYQMKKVMDLAMQLEGSPRQTGIHAAGVVVCREPISDHIPLQRSGEDITTQFNMKEVEKLGLLKIDFLGLRTLTDIHKTIQYVYENTGEKIDFSKSNYDDAKVFQLISSGDTEAIFQLESGGMKKLMKNLQPNCLEDIIAGISLFRPGPMDFIPAYLEGKKNAQNVKYKHPMLEDILNTTYGCMVYQEQIMQIVRKLGGFTYAQADNIRRAMGKKDKAVMKAQRDKFVHGETDENGNVLIKGAVRNGIPEKIADEIFDQMDTFAQYAFNKSHAAGYAYVSYQTAYLKQYHIVEYLAAVLNDRITSIDDIKKYTGFALSRGITLLPPDINLSDVLFIARDGKLRFGLGAIKSVGVGTVEKIIEERKKSGEFKNLEDFIKRVDSSALNKRLMENMIKAGTFDSLGETRASMLARYEVLMDRIADDKRKRESGQLNIFDLLGDDSLFETVKYDNIKEFSKKQKLEMEKEVLGMYVSGSPLDEHKEKLSEFEFNSSFIAVEADDEEGKAALQNEMDGKKVSAAGIIANISKRITKNNQSMASATIEDLYGTMQLLFFPRAFEKCKNFLREDTMVTVSGTLSVKADDSYKILVDKIEPWDEVQQTEVTQKDLPSVTLYLKFAEKNDELFAELMTLLEAYQGDIPVTLVIGKTRYPLPVKIRQCGGLQYELENLLGEANVKFVTYFY
ncbi:MAG: DNA polymerase III subunit alpha [Clostridia bacterium]|nr:DNA polymerase III subunit alpha [Clostridia bacterium]